MSIMSILPGVMETLNMFNTGDVVNVKGRSGVVVDDSGDQVCVRFDDNGETKWVATASVSKGKGKGAAKKPKASKPLTKAQKVKATKKGFDLAPDMMGPGW